MAVLYTALQVGGLLLLAVAGFLIAVWLGIALLGVAALLLGLALESRAVKNGPVESHYGATE